MNTTGTDNAAVNPDPWVQPGDRPLNPDGRAYRVLSVVFGLLGRLLVGVASALFVCLRV